MTLFKSNPVSPTVTLENIRFSRGFNYTVENNPHTNAYKRRDTSMPDSHEFALVEGSDRVRHVVHRFSPLAARNSQSSSSMSFIRFSMW